MVTPTREFRLLIHGIQSWVRHLLDDLRTPPRVGLLEGPEGQGKHLLLESLTGSCKKLGIRVFGGQFSRRYSAPGGGFLEIIRQLLAAGENHPDIAACIERYASELRWFCPDSRWPLPAEPDDAVADEPDADESVSDGPVVDEPVADEPVADGPVADGPEILAGPGKVAAIIPDQARLIDSVVNFLLAVGKAQPSVLILSDVENSDPLSREIFQHLLRLVRCAEQRRRAYRLLVVFSRNSERPARPRLGVDSTEDKLAVGKSPEGGDSEFAFRLGVRGFSREDIREYSVNANLSLSLSEREAIYRQTDGGVLQTLRLLGPIERREGDEHALAIRDLPRLVKKRFDNMSSEERVLLSISSVVDYALSLTDLARVMRAVAPVSGAPDSDTWAANGCTDSLSGEWLETVDRLRREHWIQFGDLGANGPDRLVSLERDVRSEIASCARGLTEPAFREAVFSELGRGELSGPEASQFVQRFLFGGAGSGVDSGVLGEGMILKAVRHLERIGADDLALEVFDALPELEDASGERRGELEELRIQLLTRTGSYREALDSLASHVASEDDPRACAALHLRVSALAERIDRRSQVETSLDRAQSLLENCDPCPEQVDLLIARAEAAYSAEDSENCKGLCLEARQLFAERHAEGKLPIGLLELESRLAQSCRQHEDALLLEEEILLRLKEGREAEPVATCLQRKHRLELRLKRVEDAERSLQSAVVLASASGSRILLASTLISYADHAASSHCYRMAHRCLIQARSIFVDFGRAEQILDLEKRLLVLDLRLGRFQTAASTLWKIIEGIGKGEASHLLNSFGSDTGRDEEERFTRDQKAEVRKLQSLEKLQARGADRLDADQLIELADLWKKRGHLSQSLALVLAAKERDDFRPQTEERAVVLRLEGQIEFLRGHTDQAIESYQRSLECFVAAPDRESLGIAYLDIGSFFKQRGHLGLCLDYSLRGLEIFLREELEDGILFALNRLADFLLEGGQVSAGGRFALAGATMARSRGLVESELEACRLIIRAASDSGDEYLCRTAVRRALSLDSRLQCPLESCCLRLELGWSEFLRGEHREAMSSARAAIEIARNAGLQSLLSELLLLTAVIDGDSANPHGNFIRAIETVEKIIEESERNHRPRNRWHAFHVMANIYDGRGKSDLATDYRTRADSARAKPFGSGAGELGKYRWARRERPERGKKRGHVCKIAAQ